MLATVCWLRSFVVATDYSLCGVAASQADRHLPETADAVPDELDEEEAELQLYIKYWCPEKSPVTKGMQGDMGLLQFAGKWQSYIDTFRIIMVAIPISKSITCRCLQQFVDFVAL